MLTLYSGSGSQSLQILTRYYGPPDDEQNILFTACQLLIARGETIAANILASEKFEIWEATNDFTDGFHVLSTSRDIAGYEEWRKLLDHESDSRKEYQRIFSSIAETINEVGVGFPESDSYIRFIVCHLRQTFQEGDINWRHEIITATAGANNQGVFNFRDAVKLTKDGLNFRSKTEIRVYEALVKKGLLVLPLPVAVLGDTKIRREPDFVVAYRGKMGVLEIHGEKWHPPEAAAKEAERRRSLRNLGVAVYEVFDAKRCWNETQAVVAEFLRAFENLT